MNPVAQIFSEKHRLKRQLEASQAELREAGRRLQKALEEKAEDQRIIDQLARVVEEQDRAMAMLCDKVARDQLRAERMALTLDSLLSQVETQNETIAKLQEEQKHVAN